MPGHEVLGQSRHPDPEDQQCPSSTLTALASTASAAGMSRTGVAIASCGFQGTVVPAALQMIRTVA
ncbi:hypothetical protein AMK32_09750 [Streptomyces sp. CB01883]|nr:hypothetical protein AMK32_09750 [Streptomyces sp. CB01883]